MKTPLAILALMFAATAADAQIYTRSTSTPRGTYTTIETFRMPRPAVTWHEDFRTPEEIEKRTMAWEARCQPVIGAPDRNGVSRYVYAAPGCEFGD